MKNNLRKLGKIVSQERKNSHMRTDLHRLKRQFRGLLKRKKTAFVNNIYNDMQANVRDSKQLWKMLDKLKKQHEEKVDHIKSIRPTLWIDSFKKLLTTQNSETVESDDHQLDNSSIPSMDKIIDDDELQKSSKKFENRHILWIGSNCK